MVKLRVNHNTFVLISSFVILLSIPFTVRLAQLRQEIRSRAKTGNFDAFTPVLELNGFEFASDELLVKFRKDTVKRLKVGDRPSSSSGISSVDNILAKHKVKSVEKIAKEGKNSIKEADVFSWYKVTIDTEKKKVKHDDPEVKEVNDLKTALLNNPEIESVEYNSVFKILQQSSACNFVSEWGVAGNGDGQFLEPQGLARDSMGEVYVTDYQRNDIQVFVLSIQR